MTYTGKIGSDVRGNVGHGKQARRAARKVLSGLVAGAMVATSAFPAAADTFYFRYKTPVSWAPDTVQPTPDVELGEGNDITIFFTGVIGQSFSKVIPVKTKDVVKWEFVSGKLQTGLVLDASSGVVSGVAAGDTKKKVAKLVGYDVGGRLIAKASITSTFRNPSGDSKEFTFYGHTNKYMYRKIPTSVSAVDHWTSITDMPYDFHVDGSYLAGTATSEGTTGVGFVGNDYVGNEVTFTYGDLVIEDGPRVEPIADQIRHPEQSFSVSADVKLHLGDVKYRLIGLDGIPKTISFGTYTGKLSGTIPTFNTSLRFQVEAMDIDGTKGLSNVFTLSTSLPDLAVADLKDLVGTVGKPFSLKLVADDKTGATTWSVKAGILPDGITLDPDTGILSGTPTREQVQTDLVIAVDESTGSHAESQPFAFKIYAKNPAVTFAPLDLRVGKSFKTAGPVLGQGVVAPYRFEPVSGAVVSDDAIVDYQAATVSGTATAAGEMSVPFEFVNGDAHRLVVTQAITAHDALALSYPDKVTLYRRTTASASPSYDPAAIIGAGAFKLTVGALPDGLSLDQSTGEIGGTPTKVGEAIDLAVTLSDDSGESVVSNVFDIDVQDRPGVEVDAGQISVERYVDNDVPAATAANTFDGVTFTLVQGTLPAGLALDADGHVRGSTTAAIGQYDGFQVQAMDGEGYSALSPVFSITVTQPADLQPLDQAQASAEWTQDVRFSLPLPRPANAFGSIVYDLTNLPSGVSVAQDKLVGEIGALGTYAFPMTLTDDAGRVLQGTYTLTILEAMTASLDGTGKRQNEITDELFFDLPRGSHVTVGPKLSNAIEPVAITTTGALPSGLSFDPDDGVASGVPSTEGQKAPVSFRVVDAAGTVVDLSGTLVVVARLPVELAYDPAFPAGFVGKNMAAVMPSVKNAIGAVTYEMTAGTLPPGVVFDKATGYFTGKPTKNGVFRGFDVTATDSEGAAFAGSSGPFDIGVQYGSTMALANKTYFSVRADRPFARSIPVQNATDPVQFYSSAGLADGASVSTDGIVSGSLSIGGHDLGTVTAQDYFGQKKSTQVSVTALGPLSIAPPTTTVFNAYSISSASPVVTNGIGTLKFELVSGKLPAKMSMNAATGLISGRPEAIETQSGIVIKVTDESGDSVQTTPFTLRVDPRLPLAIYVEDVYPVTANVATKVQPTIAHAVDSKSVVITAGVLPPGLALDASTGSITGKATDIGAFPISLQVTDGLGAQVSASFTIQVGVKGIINLTTKNFSTRVGYPILTEAPTYSNHVGAVKFSADVDLSSYGLTIDPATGVISGTATALLDVTPNINISDASLRVTSKPVQIQVLPNIAIDVPDVIDRAVNTTVDPYIYAKAKYAVGNVVWTSSGKLPAGMYFSTYYKRFGGRPTEMGTFNVVLTATETSGFQQTVSHVVTINVISDGLVPTPTVNPVSTGYLTSATTNVGYTVQNFKTGMVLSLSPDSKPLPPGVSFDMSGAKPVIRKASVADDASGIYEGLKIRATNPDGLFADSEPFTLIFKSSLDYDDVRMTKGAFETISAATPVPSKGKTIGDVSYAWYSNRFGETLKIDPKTGAISGYVTKTGTNTVSVTSTYAGKVISKVYFSFSVTATQVSISTAKDQVSYTGIAFPAFPATLTNGLAGGALSVEGRVPAGLSFDAATRSIVGVPTEAGDFPVDLVYADAYQTIRQPFAIRVEQASDASTGYKYVKLALASKNRQHVWSIDVLNQAGYSTGHIFDCGTGTTGQTCAALKGKSHYDFPANAYQILDLPTFVAGGSAVFGMHGSGSMTVSVSPDGTNWKDVQTIAMNGDFKTYTVPFSWALPQITLDAPGATSKVGMPFATPAPTYSLAQAGVRFYTDDDLSGSNLAVDGSTGVISGSLDTTQTKNVRLSVTDDTGRVTTKTVTINVLPAMTLSAPTSTTVKSGLAMAALKVVRTNVYGTATWDAVDATTLPPGVSFNTVGGQFEGTPTKAGTFGPILVTSRDALGDVGSTYVTIVVEESASFAFKDLSVQSIPTAQKRVAWSFDLKDLIADDLAGLAKDDLTFAWTWTDKSQFPNYGGDLVQTGSVLSGTMKNSGVGRITVTASYAGVSKSQDYAFTSVLPATSMTLSKNDAAFGTTDLGSAIPAVALADLLSVQNIDKASVRWSVMAPAALDADETAGIPTGVALNPTSGVVSGTPTVAGRYRFAVKAVFDDTRAVAEHVEATQEYVVDVAAPKVITLPATIQSSVVFLANYDVDFAARSTISGMKPSDVTWSVVLDQAGDAMVPGLTLSTGGRLQGQPLASGNYAFGIKAEGAGVVATARYRISVESEAVSRIASDFAMSCMTKVSGAVSCWGDNTNGTLGNGSTAANSLVPVASTLVTGKTVDIVGGYSGHMCALKDDGTVWCWGLGNSGQLGNGSNATSRTPVQVSGLTDVRQIVAGYRHTCALKTDGSMWCWGESGGIGYGVATNKNVPTQPTGMSSGVISMAGGNGYSCASKSDGTVWCWGGNGNGRLGDGTTAAKLVPTRVSNLSNVTAMAGGYDHTCAVRSDKTVWCWGSAATGQLGNGKTSGDFLTPEQVTGLTDAYVLSSGDHHNCAIKTDRSVVCWGKNSNGQLGDNTFTSRSVPVTVSGFANATSISAVGYNHTCATKSDGSAWCWGSNSAGQLGNNSAVGANVATPVRVSGT